MITQPTASDNAMVRKAFKDYEEKQLALSNNEFSTAIERWKELNRPRDELVSLIKARANVRLDMKEFQFAIQDYDQCIELMKYDGETEDGKARYPEYPDTFVGKGLANAGLSNWLKALDDYDKAISLWGGLRSADRIEKAQGGVTSIDYSGINPYVLTFRGNALRELHRYQEALLDFEAASDSFIQLKDIARFSDARANYALTLYELGRIDESTKVMKDIIRKNPGYADMRVALAADYWSKGDYINALKQWKFTCDEIEVGCEAYKDLKWVKEVRRWPDALTTKLRSFLTRETP